MLLRSSIEGQSEAEGCEYLKESNTIPLNIQFQKKSTQMQAVRGKSQGNKGVAWLGSKNTFRECWVNGDGDKVLGVFQGQWAKEFDGGRVVRTVSRWRKSGKLDWHFIEEGLQSQAMVEIARCLSFLLNKILSLFTKYIDTILLSLSGSWVQPCD